MWWLWPSQFRCSKAICLNTDFYVHFGIRCYISGCHSNDCKYDCCLVCDAVQCVLMFYRNLLFESSPDHQIMATAVSCESLVHFCGLLRITQKMVISIVTIAISLTCAVVSYKQFYYDQKLLLSFSWILTHSSAFFYTYQGRFIWFVPWPTSLDMLVITKRGWKCFEMLEHESWLFIY